MDCLILPVSMFKRCYTGNSRIGYRQLTEEKREFDDIDGPLWTLVVVGKEKREFLVDPLVLEESPFRFLLETVKKDEVAMKTGHRCDHKHRRRQPPVMFVDVDAILFEHMLWLMYNDCSSLFSLNLEEIIDFYAQDY